MVGKEGGGAGYQSLGGSSNSSCKGVRPPLQAQPCPMEVTALPLSPAAWPALS